MLTDVEVQFSTDAKFKNSVVNLCKVGATVIKV